MFNTNTMFKATLGNWSLSNTPIGYTLSFSGNNAFGINLTQNGKSAKYWIKWIRKNTEMAKQDLDDLKTLFSCRVQSVGCPVLCFVSHPKLKIEEF